MLGKDLDGDTAVKTRVARVPHFARTTSAEPRNDLVRIKACTRFNGRHKAVWIEREYISDERATVRRGRLETDVRRRRVRVTTKRFKRG
jgi:hypothetical protein